MTHIYGHTWPVRWGAVGEKKEVLVFSNCEEAQLYVNGISQGVKKEMFRIIRQPDFIGTLFISQVKMC